MLKIGNFADLVGKSSGFTPETRGWQKHNVLTMFDDIQPVNLSSRAAAEVKKIMQTKNIPAEYGLRVGVRGGGGCGGATLIIGFDKKKDSDLAYKIDGIPVYVDKKHTLYLIGKEIEFYEGADAKGFMFVDQPQGSRTTSDS